MILAFCLITGLVSAQTVARRIFDSWLDAFNSGDRAKITAYLETYAPDHVKDVENELNFRQRTGGFELVRITQNSDTEFDAILRERAGEQFGRIHLVIAGDPPHVTAMALRPTDPPDEFRAAAANDADLVAQAIAAADAQAAKDEFSGAVLIARNGKILLEKAWGFADRDNKVRNTSDTKFRIGSMNKMFTAVSILQLVAKSKISLDGAIAAYWPGYPNKDLAAKVTIRHLLSHSGGTGDIFGPEFDKHRPELRTLSDYGNLFGSRPLAFEPGSRFSYSNYGFLLLGLIAEKVSGTNYYDYVRENVFAPAGMKHTDSLPENEPVANRSTGYRKENGAWIPNTDTLPWSGTSAGGGYSTVGDLFRFAEALRSGKLISRAMLTEATRKQTPDDTPYGFGFETGDSYGHGGGAPGMNGELRIFPASGYVIAVLANLDPPAASRISDAIRTRLPK